MKWLATKLLNIAKKVAVAFLQHFIRAFKVAMKGLLPSGSYGDWAEHVAVMLGCASWLTLLNPIFIAHPALTPLISLVAVIVIHFVRDFGVEFAQLHKLFDDIWNNIKAS